MFKEKRLFDIWTFILLASLKFVILLTYNVIKKGIINNIFSFCLTVKNFFGLVKMTFGLVDVGYSLPKGQAVKLIFFAPCQ